MLISLAMIVKNEEAMMAHCLESVKALVDEIIVVDTGSTDKTIDIAKEFGARVYPFKWRDDFSAARNESLKYCKADWVLILDADEAIDPLDYETIKNACLRPQADAYSLIHRNYVIIPNVSLQDTAFMPNASDYSEGRELPFYADIPGLRLARMFDGLAFKSRIHESFEESVISGGRTIKDLDAVIHHYGKLLAEREEYKAQYYLTLARREADANPGFAAAQFKLLQQALVAKQWEVAVMAAQAYLKLASALDPFVLYGGGMALHALNRHEEAIRYFDLLLSQHPEHAMAMLAKGHSYRAMGNFSACRELIMKTLDLEPGNVTAHKRLAELEYDENNLDAARKAALNAMALAQDEPLIYDFLIRIEMTRDNPQQAVQDALLAIQRCPGGGEGRWHHIAAVYFGQLGQRAKARSILELGLKSFPGEPDLMRLKGMI
jgi:glycosyltransferase involved in cell wall biosynthesis